MTDTQNKSVTVLDAPRPTGAEIYGRQSVDLDRSTLADWVGRAAFELRPVHDALMPACGKRT